MPFLCATFFSFENEGFQSTFLATLHNKQRNKQYFNQPTRPKHNTNPKNVHVNVDAVAALYFRFADVHGNLIWCVLEMAFIV